MNTSFAPAFSCGHLRTPDNTRMSHERPSCRTCYREWDAARRERARGPLSRVIDAEQSRERRLRKILADAAAAKPHLYPNQQAA